MKLDIEQLQILLQFNQRNATKELRELFDLEKNFKYIDYELKILNIYLENHDLETSLFDFSKCIKKTEVFNQFLKYILEKFDFSYIYIKIKTNEFKFLSAYFRNKLNFCLECGKPTLNKFCSLKCSNNSNKVKELKEKSYFEKFGTTNPMYSNEVKHKIRQKNNIKYGCDWFYQSNEFKEKSKISCLEKYGVEHAQTSNEIKEKIRNTNNERHGVNAPMQCKEIKEKSKLIVQEKYNVENVFQLNEIKEKSKQTKLIKYGNENFNNREKSELTCLERYKVKNPSQIHIKNFENLNEVYIKNNFIHDDKIDILEMSKYFGLTKNGCKHILRKINILKLFSNSTRKIVSIEEQNLFNSIIAENKVQSDRKIIYPLELDIYLPDYKLAIEYNGSYWHSEFFKTKNYHLNKTNLCKEKGIDLIHVFDFDDLEIVKSLINEKIGLNTKINAFECTIKEINENEQIKDFINKNNLEKYTKTDKNFCFYYKEDLIKIISLRKNEIVRNTTLNGFEVENSLKRLLNTFKFEKLVVKINRRFETEKEYLRNGFKIVKETKPYFKLVDSHLNVIENFKRFKDLSGYFKVYDCGKLILEKI